MKTKKQTFTLVLAALFMFLLTAINSQSQIQFEGLYSEGEGGAAWNADGSGIEPFGNGHGGIYYYSASRDYLDATSSAGAHMLGGINGFPMFEQALLDNGFTAGQVTLKISLCDLGEDIEGVDWFTLGNMNYSNFYPVQCILELDGESMVEATGNYSVYIVGGSIQGFESAYLKVSNISGNSPDPVKIVAEALLSDIGVEELHFDMQVTGAGAVVSGNGRSGGYFNVTGTFEKGLPTIPFQGLAADHEGTVSWNSDGTGPEPMRNGHGNYGFYGASRDFDGIDPDPNAAFAHFLDNSAGFTNFYLQLQYRGFSPDQVKIRSNACDMGEDIEGEDWFGQDTLNYYHGIMMVELNGEALIGFVHDTLNFIYESGGWVITTSPSIVYNASENSSLDIQMIANSFFKDLEMRQLSSVFEMSYVSGIPALNGRNGAFYQITNGMAIAKESNCTRVYEGDVSGQWHAACSPYIIEGEITVPAGEILNIEPGVWVKFMDRYPVNVQGSVNAYGLPTNTGDIVFTAVNPDKGWGGFDIDGTAATESVSFDNCIFEYGSAYGENALNCGGAIAVSYFDNLTIDHCLFRNNWADQPGTYLPSGGTIALWESSPVISNSIFTNNDADLGGAIMCYSGSNPEISQCLFANNSSGQDGGAIEIYSNCYPIFTNNTFALNTAVQYGGAVDIFSNSHPIFINNIFWGNEAPTGSQIAITSNNCNVSFSYCDVQGGEAGIGPNGIGAGSYENNMEDDPVFDEPLACYFRLADASPCINTGDPTLFDPDGTISDMGAFYYSIPPAPIALDGEELSNTSFYAKWEMNLAVTGYLLDVAYDQNFSNMVPGYENLDVGYTFISLVTVPTANIPYYYRVRAYNAAGISDNSNVIFVLLVGIDEPISESVAELIISPNPVNNFGNIIFNMTTASEVQIEIINFLGQSIFSLTLEKQQQGLVSIPLDLSPLLPGSYICKVTTNKALHTSKFIKN